MRHAWEAGKLPRIRDAAQVDPVLDTLRGTEWGVYSKPGLPHTETVVDYLGRYSHRIALTDSRLLDFHSQSVDLSYQDYRDGGRRKVVTLTGEELVGRFLLPVLPKGFIRGRHFSFLANRCRARRLAEIRSALAAPLPAAAQSQEQPTPFDGYPCPPCRTGRLQVITRLAPQRRDGG